MTVIAMILPERRVWKDYARPRPGRGPRGGRRRGRRGRPRSPRVSRRLASLSLCGAAPGRGRTPAPAVAGRGGLPEGWSGACGRRHRAPCVRRRPRCGEARGPGACPLSAVHARPGRHRGEPGGRPDWPTLLWLWYSTAYPSAAVRPRVKAWTCAMRVPSVTGDTRAPVPWTASSASAVSEPRSTSPGPRRPTKCRTFTAGRSLTFRPGG